MALARARELNPGSQVNYGYFLGSSLWLLSVAQPPLPLQEFFPLQPLSLDLQPPLPLHEFMPLHPCLSVEAVSLSLSPILIATPARELV